MVRNQLSKRPLRYEAQPNLCKVAQLILRNLLNSRVSSNITQTASRNELKIAVKVE